MDYILDTFILTYFYVIDHTQSPKYYSVTFSQAHTMGMYLS